MIVKARSVKNEPKYERSSQNIPRNIAVTTEREVAKFVLARIALLLL